MRAKNKLTKKSLSIFIALGLILTILSINLFISLRLNANSTDASSFGLDGNSTSDQTVQFSNMLNSNYDTIYLPDGKYSIKDTIYVNSGINKRIIGSANTTISANIDKDEYLIRLSKNIAFENITFDFNNSFARSALVYEENLGKISLKNITIKNVKDTNTTTSSVLLYIKTAGNTCDVDTVRFSNIYKQGNGLVTDYGGNITGILVVSGTNVGAANGTIKNIYIDEMHNIDGSGNILFEDTSAVYVSTSYSGADSMIYLKNINGHNSGKRLIKIDASNISIDGVISHNDTYDQLSAIGLNSGVGKTKNIVINNVKVTGYSNFGLAFDGEAKASNVYVDIKQSPLFDDAIGILISNNNITVENSDIRADRGVYFLETNEPISNTTIKNTKITINEDGSHTFHVHGTSKELNNTIIDGVTSTVNSKRSYLTSFFQASEQASSGTVNINNLKITNSSITSNSLNDQAIAIKNANGVVIDNFTVIKSDAISGRLVIDLNYLSNAILTRIISKANVTKVVNIANSKDVSIDGVASRLGSSSVAQKTSFNVSLANIHYDEMHFDSTQITTPTTPPTYTNPTPSTPNNTDTTPTPTPTTPLPTDETNNTGGSGTTDTPTPDTSSTPLTISKKDRLLKKARDFISAIDKYHQVALFLLKL